MSYTLVIGDLILDETMHVDIKGMSVEGKEALVAAYHNTTYSLGGAGNVAANLAQLGTETLLASALACLGPKAGVLRKLVSECGPHRTRTTFYEALWVYPTVKTRVIAGEQRHLLRIDDDHVNGPTHVDFLPLYDDQDLQVLVVVDYNKGFFNSHVLTWLDGLRKARPSLPVLVDPGRTGIWEAYAGTQTIFKVNVHQCQMHERAHESAGLEMPWPGPYHPDLRYPDTRYIETARRVHRNLLKLGTTFQYLIITLGAGGMVYVAAAQDPEAQVPEVVHHDVERVVDVTGAGDTALAALAHSVHRFGTDRQHLRDAVWLADKASSIAVARPGVHVVRPEEVYG